MATTVASTLYPPQFSSTFAPPFLRSEESVKIYFSISAYNSFDDIERAHVSIVRQSSEISVVNAYTSLLVKTSIKKEASTGRYYITVSKNDILGGWDINQYYKVQIRFDCAPTYTKNTESYFSNNSQYFSEWSQVLLVRAIDTPSILIEPFLSSGSNGTPTYNPGVLHIVGSLKFTDTTNSKNTVSQETETMKSYTVQVFDKTTDKAVTNVETYVSTGYGVDPNVIDCKVNTLGLGKERTLILRLGITTKLGYVFSTDYEFVLADYLTDDHFDPDVKLDLSLLDYGIVKINITNSDQLTGGNIYVRRSSNLSDFKDWETLEELKALGKLDATVTDPTVGSGVFYRYAVQMKNTAGVLTKTYYAYYTEDGDDTKQYTVFPDFYDGILYRDGKQISIRYNYKVSSIKPTVSRTKMDTLGGKYPKFIENAAMNYKQLSISGLISTQEDSEGLFLSKKDFYGDMYDNYTTYEANEYRDKATIENYNYFWEREFREKLVEWLNDGEPKLYRSMTEGLMVVMLTDVNLTPNATLSRRLCDFSATMYEVEDGHSLETLESLGIFHRALLKQTTSGDSADEDDYVEKTVPAQLFMRKLTASTSAEGIYSDTKDVIKYTIANEFKKKFVGALADKSVSDITISDVKLQFLNDPSLYTFSSNTNLVLQNGSSFKTGKSDMALNGQKVATLREGYGFTIDGTEFFVNSRGYHQIPHGVFVSSMKLLNSNDIITMDYLLHYRERNAAKSQVKMVSNQKTLVAQYDGPFDYDNYLGEAIRKRHFYFEDTQDTYYKQEMQWFKGVCVETDPYARVRIKYEDDKDYNTFVVGGTGVFHFLKDSEIEDLCFAGMWMKAVPQDTSVQLDSANPWEFQESTEKIEVDELETWRSIQGLDLSSLVEVFSDYTQFASIRDGWQDFTKDELQSVSQEASRQVALSDIKNPVYHMVYAVNDLYYIYYVDGNFYRFEFDDDTHTSGVAHVPIEGRVNYYGSIIRIEYD